MNIYKVRYTFILDTIVKEFIDPLISESVLQKEGVPNEVGCN